MKCKCASRDLFNYGCKCGAFKFENSDHIWFNGTIYSIGKTAEEAELLSKNYLKEPMSIVRRILHFDGFLMAKQTLNSGRADLVIRELNGQFRH